MKSPAIDASYKGLRLVSHEAKAVGHLLTTKQKKPSVTNISHTAELVKMIESSIFLAVLCRRDIVISD